MIRCWGFRLRHRWTKWEDVGTPGGQFSKQFQTCATCGLVRTKYMDHNFL